MESHGTMVIGDWKFNLPGYMQKVLQLAGLGNGSYSSDHFVEKISQVKSEKSLFIDIAKLLFIEFVDMSSSDEEIGLLNLSPPHQASEVEIDLVESALPEPMIGFS